MKKATSMLTLVLVGGLISAACLTTAQAAPSQDVTTSFKAFKYWNGAFRGKVATERGLCFVGQDVTVYKKRNGRAPKVLGTAPLKLGTRTEGPGRFRFRFVDPDGSYFAKFAKVTIAEYAQSWVCLGSRSETIKI
jgi:hypothetical protein